MKVSGMLLTVKYLGMYVGLREILRRLSGVSYKLLCVKVSSSTEFRLLRRLVAESSSGRLKIRCEDDWLEVSAPFGSFAVKHSDLNLLSVVTESLEEMYLPRDGAPKDVVVDVGSFIGDTALMFAWYGARRVYALEPVPEHFNYMVQNLKRNEHGSRVVPIMAGVWIRSGELEISYCGIGSGLCESDRKVRIKVMKLGDVLRRVVSAEGKVDLMKMDCEGCEAAILIEPCEVLRMCPEYVIEVHGPPLAIIDKMMGCGFRHELVRKVSDIITVYRFSLNEI
ncbi:MAG: FkbM family methyltransferase [Sulfolobales archaeon]|nr:FkbM family methyltransferase [Sulfolobales archaeon]MDW8083015.1 FkbM family methyltransferase [Sulfolobales archaeon]